MASGGQMSRIAKKQKWMSCDGKMSRIVKRCEVDSTWCHIVRIMSKIYGYCKKSSGAFIMFDKVGIEKICSHGEERMKNILLVCSREWLGSERWGNGYEKYYVLIYLVKWVDSEGKSWCETGRRMWERRKLQMVVCRCVGDVNENVYSLRSA